MRNEVSLASVVHTMVIKGYRSIVEPNQDVKDLKFLIEQWREKEMVFVRSCDIVPDGSNRMHTGLSVDHVHYLATLMMKDGFRGRSRGPIKKGYQPHDIPVLVRGSPKSEMAVESLHAFSLQVTSQMHFARVMIEPDAKNWYCSLGNGHFSQALNCFRP